MSLTTVKNKINDWLDPRWDWLAGKQDDYFAIHGGYFQAFWTHTGEIIQTDALDGDMVPDNLTSHPSDQAATWQDAVGSALDSLLLPARMKIDVYEGPLGHGWTAALQVKYQGDIYERAKSVGPEDRTHNWKKVEILI